MDEKIEEEIDDLFRAQRKKTLEKKFKEQNQDGVLKEDNIWEMIEKLKMTENFTKEISKKIFEDIDKNKQGYIKIDEFLDYLFNKNIKFKDELKPFYEKILNQLLGKSEKIISKLKRLKQKSYLANDKESIDDIDWIISCITDTDLNEPDYIAMSRMTHDAKDYNDISSLGLEYISQYSQFWDRERKILDLETVKIKNLKDGYHSHDSQLPLENGKDPRKLSVEGDIHHMVTEIFENLSSIDNYEYNIFDLNDLAEKHSLSYLSYEIFWRLKYFEDGLIKEPKFKSFLKEITRGYDRNVTYHNDLHAGDVLQTVFCIILKGNWVNKLFLQKIDIISVLVSAIIHDYKHPGLNNFYQINAKTKLAIRYNDQSTLENHHVSQSFKLLMKNEFNIFDQLSPEEFRLVRRRMIECILATDMANHAKTLSGLKSKCETFEIKGGNNLDRMIFTENLSKTFENQQTVLSMLIHTADISNPAKPSSIQKTWVDLLFIEFFKQGDLEAKSGLPISLLCDRNTTNIDKSQIGFISFIVIPTFDSLLNVIPEISQFMTYLKSNLKKYEELCKQG